MISRINVEEDNELKRLRAGSPTTKNPASTGAPWPRTKIFGRIQIRDGATSGISTSPRSPNAIGDSLNQSAPLPQEEEIFFPM